MTDDRTHGHTYEVWYSDATRRADAGLAGTDAGASMEPRHGTAHARLYGCADDQHRALITPSTRSRPMRITDDPQDALELWDDDETQWILTDGVEYAVGPEIEALHALMTSGWEMTSPETLIRQIRN